MVGIFHKGNYCIWITSHGHGWNCQDDTSQNWPLHEKSMFSPAVSRLRKKNKTQTDVSGVWLVTKAEIKMIRRLLHASQWWVLIRERLESGHFPVTPQCTGLTCFYTGLKAWKKNTATSNIITLHDTPLLKCTPPKAHSCGNNLLMLSRVPRVTQYVEPTLLIKCSLIQKYCVNWANVTLLLPPQADTYR